MQFPDYREFSRLAAGGASLVPVARTVAADLRTPVSAFLSIAAEEPNAFLLESVEGGEKIGRYTFLGARPYMVLTAAGDEITIQRGRKREIRRGQILPVVRELLGEQGFQLAHADGGQQQGDGGSGPRNGGAQALGSHREGTSPLVETTFTAAQLIRQRGLLDTYA